MTELQWLLFAPLCRRNKFIDSLIYMQFIVAISAVFLKTALRPLAVNSLQTYFARKAFKISRKQTGYAFCWDLITVTTAAPARKWHKVIVAD